MGDRSRWDGKHAERADAAPRPPDPFVEEFLSGLEREGTRKPGRAVDLACGRGRHALELARRGWEVEAWDVSPVALEILRERALRAGARVVVREVDLREPFPAAALDAFDLALCVDYLDRELLTRVARLLVPGGLFVLATFTLDHPAPRPGPHHRLRPGELASGLPALDAVRWLEAGGRAGWVGRRRGSDPPR